MLFFFFPFNNKVNIFIRIINKKAALKPTQLVTSWNNDGFLVLAKIYET